MEKLFNLHEFTHRRSIAEFIHKCLPISRHFKYFHLKITLTFSWHVWLSPRAWLLPGCQLKKMNNGDRNFY